MDEQFEEIDRLLEERDPVSANRLAREIVEADPKSARGWAYQGQSSLQLERFGDAEYEFNQAIRLDPNVALFHARLAAAYAQQDKQREAEASISQAIRLDPADADYKFHLGSLVGTRGDTGRAVTLLKEAYDADPRDVDKAQTYSYAILVQITELWPEWSDGTRSITSEEMLNRSRELLVQVDQIGALDRSDADYKEVADVIDDASKTQVDGWGEIGRGLFGVILTIVIGSFLGGISAGAAAVFILIGLALSGFWIWRHIQPGWKINARALKRNRTFAQAE